MALKWHAIEFNELPEEGRVTLVKKGGKSLALAKVDNTYFAFQDKCPHAGASLSGGKLVKKYCIECPHHRFTFDVRTGQMPEGAGLYVETYPLRENNGLWEIGIKKFFGLF